MDLMQGRLRAQQHLEVQQTKLNGFGGHWAMARSRGVGDGGLDGIAHQVPIERDATIHHPPDGSQLLMLPQRDAPCASADQLPAYCTSMRRRARASTARASQPCTTRVSESAWELLLS